MEDVKTTVAPAAAQTPVKKAKTIPLLLLSDGWLDDGEGGVRRLETNVKKLDDKGKPYLDATTGDYAREQIVHDVPIEIAKIWLAEGKAQRRDPLPE